jgi:ABC-2 type transport system permease protein
MKKIILIAFREFFLKIRNKLFLVTTLLLPIGIAVFYGAIFFFGTNDNEFNKIGVIDASQQFYHFLKNDKNFEFKKINTQPIQADEAFYTKNDINALLIFPDSVSASNKDQIRLVYKTKLGMISKSELMDKIQTIFEIKRFEQKNIDASQIESVKQEVAFDIKSWDGKGENLTKETLSYGIGFGLGILMYVILTIYGSQVMRGVMEEKTNRIAEIIISSVKPFELMMGKIVGIGLVCLLQFSIWGVLIMILNLGVAYFLGNDAIQQTASAGPMGGNAEMVLQVTQNMKELNLFPIIGGFLFYFLGGYFLYSSMFASVGSAVNEDPQDVQSLMMPIMMPIFFSFILLTKAINNPNSTEAIIGSMVPFTSPVVMMSRIVFGIPEGVPLWQLALSMIILLATTFFFVWMASRIYRVGILMYGKKTNWKEMIQWIFTKQ